jgi:hypothetical protein
MVNPLIPIASRGETKTLVVPLAIDASGQRLPSWERQPDKLFQAAPAESRGSSFPSVLGETIEPMLQRELQHRGISGAPGGYDARLIVGRGSVEMFVSS